MIKVILSDTAEALKTNSNSFIPYVLNKNPGISVLNNFDFKELFIVKNAHKSKSLSF